MITFIIQGSGRKQAAHFKGVTGESLMKGLLKKDGKGPRETIKDQVSALELVTVGSSKHP